MAPTTTATKRPKHAHHPNHALRAKHTTQPTLEIYHSTSSGHQVCNGISKPAVAWHRSRQSKLNRQFKDSSLLLPPPPSSLSSSPAPSSSSSPSSPTTKATTTTAATASIKAAPTAAAPSSIFKACSIYISGSTAPLIGDHALKHVLARHGARLCTLLRRSSTTHVILSAPARVGAGAGGGLAAAKLQREIDSKKAVAPIRYVGVQWVLDSIVAGRRLPERDYSPAGLSVGRSAGQTSLLDGFLTTTAATTTKLVR